MPEPKDGGVIDKALYKRHSASNKASPAYGDEEGQIQNFTEGSHQEVIGALTSPPFLTANDGGGINKIGNRPISMRGVLENGSLSFGNSEGQIANMPEGNINGAITSPPYSEGLGHGGKGNEIDKAKRLNHNTYGKTDGQVQNLPEGDHSSITEAITSPPWEDNLSADRLDPTKRRNFAREMGESNSENISPIDMEKVNGREQKDARYGISENQIGTLSGETYWSAVAIIYQQVYQLLPPGGAFAIVIKDFVRNKKRVPLCDQTAELLKAIGFEIPERIHAMLVKEIPQPVDMFTNEAQPKIVERKSFFRRLAEKKGSPRIDWEEVIWAVKP
jgi:hypothetical protein